jgi:hypothetical protein
MKKILVFLSVSLFLISYEASAQKLNPRQQQELNKLFKAKKVVYFKFMVNSTQEVSQLGKIISVDKTRGPEVIAHATKEQFAKFLPFNYKYTPVSSPQPKKKPRVVSRK